jgi:hypothetical protein
MHGRLDSIKRCVGAINISLTYQPHNEFSVLLLWPGGKEYTKKFTRAMVFGSSMQGPEVSWQIEKTACAHASDLVREVLELRGVI